MKIKNLDLISDYASERATSYTMANKIVTRDGQTHAVWTDFNSRSAGRTFDHASGQWSKPTIIGQGDDNHNSPALTMDAEGKLHIAYGPHGICGVWGDADTNWPSGCFRYAVSHEPNSFKGLEKMEITPRINCFGYMGTYASLIHTPSGEDVIAYRGGEYPYSTLIQKRSEGTRWSHAQQLFAQDVGQVYTHYGTRVICDKDGTLFVASHFYNVEVNRSIGVSVMKSSDGGTTWLDLNDQAMSLPAYYGEATTIPHTASENDPRICGLAVDPQGKLWASTSTFHANCDEILLSCWEGNAWRTIDLREHLPKGWTFKEGPMTIDRHGRIHQTLEGCRIDDIEKNDEFFGVKGMEVFLLTSEDGGKSFECLQVSESHELPNWQPSISQHSPLHPVDNPVIIYTQGMKSPEECEIPPKVLCAFTS